MKLKYTLLFSLALFTACSENDPGSENNGKRLWELSEIISFNGTVTPKEDLTYNETIELRTDKTFTKLRLRDDVVITETNGTFLFEYNDNRDYLYLDHETNNDLVINCTGDTRETYVLQDDALFNTANACDWPVLKFTEAD